jgi:hypothetical protein
MDLDTTCAIAILWSILIAALKILTVALAVVTTLVRLLNTLRSRRRHRPGRGRVHLQAHAVGDDQWLRTMLREPGSSVQTREREGGTECPSGRTWR